MKGIFRLFKIVPYEYINEKLADVVSAERNFREEKRASALDAIQSMGQTIESSQVMKIMSDLQKDLDNSHARETLLVDFINKVKE